MKKIIVSILAVSLIGFVGTIAVAAKPAPPSPGIAGKVIALDAGHGGTSLGAQYPANSGSSGQILEKDVNLAVVYKLKEKLELNDAHVVLARKCDENLSLRERADIATAECKAQFRRNCDVFLAVHHNGNIDATHDGTLVIYNGGGNNKTFAKFMHNALIASLSLLDEGYLSGGYGSTIYGNFTQALTEAYYITNITEANANLAGTPTTVCQNSGIDYQVKVGTRTQQEVDAQYQGLVNYFSR